MDRLTKECSGCMACKSICPGNCIQIKTDHIGNFVRLIDMDRCKQCGLCEKICPSKVLPRMMMPQKAYAARSKKVERKSASGGIATGIYRYCISNKLVCVGVRYDDSLIARYDFINGTEDIDKFASSKYVHSHMGNIYQEILAYLRKGRKVVFIGLPCHVAALRNMLDGQDDNLICVDLVCHGVVSNRFLSEHIDHIRGVKRSDIGFIEFREKGNEFGVTLKAKGTNKILKAVPNSADEYMSAYSQGFIYCEQCYQCRYAQEKRCSDLTIKDLGTYCSQYKLSGVLVNTEKGRVFLEKLEPYFMMFDYPVDRMIAEDAMLRRPTPRGKRREWFLRLYPLLGYDKTVRVVCFHTILKGKGQALLNTCKYYFRR